MASNLIEKYRQRAAAVQILGKTVSDQLRQRKLQPPGMSPNTRPPVFWIRGPCAVCINVDHDSDHRRICQICRYCEAHCLTHSGLNDGIKRLVAAFGK